MMSWLVPLLIMVLAGLVVWALIWVSNLYDFPIFPVVVLAGALGLILFAGHLIIRDACEKEIWKGWVCK